MALAYALEKQVAISAVLRACSLTSSVFNKLVKDETVTKNDKSPVTVADYSAQAVISTILARAFPNDPIVGEEDTSALRGGGVSQESQLLRDRITVLSNEALREALRRGDDESWGIGPHALIRTTEELLDAIDRGNHPGGSKSRMWTLDPIDGTKGFLRGEQYAVCLALIVDSKVKVGVIGCPNLPHDWNGNHEDKGVLFVAVEGQGAEQKPFFGGKSSPLKLTPSVPRRLLESYESGHSSHGVSERVSKILGITEPPLRLDSQVKYGALARGDGMAYFRMPAGVGYEEKIWDHASGNLIVSEAGGIVTDSRGQFLNFGLGRTLGENFGVIGCGKEDHSNILKAIQQVQRESTNS